MRYELPAIGQKVYVNSKACIAFIHGYEINAKGLTIWMSNPEGIRPCRIDDIEPVGANPEFTILHVDTPRGGCGTS